MTSVRNILNLVTNFEDVKEHYTKEQFLDIMIDIMENTVIKNNLDFDMLVFSNIEDTANIYTGKDYLSAEQFQQDLHNCGTSCCMLGWAASDKRLLDKGLYLDMEGTIDVKSKYIERDSFNFHSPLLQTITGMSGDELNMLFGGYYCERRSGLFNVFPEYEDEDYEELDKILPKHFKTSVSDDNPKYALEALRWYKDKLHQISSTSDSKSI